MTKIRRKKSSPNPPYTTAAKKYTRRKTSATHKIRRQLKRLSPERKLDIIGIALVLLGLMSLLGLITGQQDGLFGALTKLLQQVGGFGAFLLPLVFLLLGAWLVLRNENRLPIISTERLLGIVLLVINLFTWTHWFSGGGWEKAQAGEGGGYLGAVFERILTATLGDWGGLVALLAWFLTALTLTFDISIPDLMRKITHTAGRTKEMVSTGVGKISDKALSTKQLNGDAVGVGKSSHTAAEGFMPLSKPRLQKIQDVSRQDMQPSVTSQSVITDISSQTTAGSGKLPVAGGQLHPARSAMRPPRIEEILNAPIRQTLQADIDQERVRIIEETLSSLNAPAKVVEIQHGPTFTQFCIEPGYIQTRKGRIKVRVNTINSYGGDLALALSAHSVRVEAPVPGRPYIGLEVPNKEAELVTLREGMESKAFKEKRGTLRFVLGKDVSGRPLVADLANMPHLLIAGATNSGKSVCLNSFLTCLLLQFPPDQLRLVLVDPKRVEFTNYNGIPHLLTPVVVAPEKVIRVLQWLLAEMDSRYLKFQKIRVRNIEEYNSQAEEKLPYIVLLIDELADLMMLAPAETEISLNRLAQMSRATGIHLVIATQRPSVDIITGKIKANFPARISFAVASGIDSRVVIDKVGADDLIGRGDMLYQSPELSNPKRLQGVFVSDAEIQRLVEYWHQLAVAYQKEETSDLTTQLNTIPVSALQEKQVPLFDHGGEMGEDPVTQKAIDIIRVEERASISLLQRKLGIGYVRAARLIEHLEEKGIIGKPEPNSGVRPVLDFGDEKPE